MEKQKQFTVSEDALMGSLNIGDLKSAYGITLFDNEMFRRIMGALKVPMRTTDLAIALCTGGSAVVYSNFKRIDLCKNSATIIHPGCITYIESEDNVEIESFVINSSIFSDGSFNMQVSISIIIDLLETKLVKLTDYEVQIIRKLFELLDTIISSPETGSSRERVGYAIKMLLCTIKDSVVRSNEGNVTFTEKLTRKEEIFKKFLKIASANYLNERSIDFYAQKLCISPKYLSAVSKDMSGCTVMEWLNRFIIMEAKSMLKYSEKSVMEIADHLYFSTPSSFGKYFKKNTGLTPGEYRNSSMN